MDQKREPVWREEVKQRIVHYNSSRCMHQWRQLASFLCALHSLPCTTVHVLTMGTERGCIVIHAACMMHSRSCFAKSSSTSWAPVSLPVASNDNRLTCNDGKWGRRIWTRKAYLWPLNYSIDGLKRKDWQPQILSICLQSYRIDEKYSRVQARMMGTSEYI